MAQASQAKLHRCEPKKLPCEVSLCCTHRVKLAWRNRPHIALADVGSLQRWEDSLHRCKDPGLNRGPEKSRPLGPDWAPLAGNVASLVGILIALEVEGALRMRRGERPSERAQACRIRLCAGYLASKAFLV